MTIEDKLQDIQDLLGEGVDQLREIKELLKVPSPPTPTPPIGKLICSYNKGDITPTAWNYPQSFFPHVNNLVYNNHDDFETGTNPIETGGRKRANRGGNNLVNLPKVGHMGVSGNSSSKGGDGTKAQLWKFNAGHLIPRIRDGWFVCDSPIHAGDNHCMLLPHENYRNKVGGYKESVSWLENHDYTCQWEMMFPSTIGAYQVPWILFYQLRGDGFTGPQVGLYWKRVRKGSDDYHWTIRILDKHYPLKKIPVPGSTREPYNFELEVVLAETLTNQAPKPKTILKYNGDIVWAGYIANSAGTNYISNTLGNYQQRVGRKESEVLIGDYNLWYRGAA